MTLLEIMCALAIVALVMGAILGVLRGTVRTIEGTHAVMREARVGHGISRVMQSDFEGAFAASEKGMHTLVVRAVNLDEGGTSLEFTTTKSFGLRGERAGPGLCRVEYILRPSAQMAGLRELIRKETPYVVGRPLERDQTLTERLADGVALWRVQCYDGSEWEHEWRRNRLPVALRVDLALGVGEDPAGRSETLYFSALVNPDVDPVPILSGGAGKGGT